MVRHISRKMSCGGGRLGVIVIEDAVLELDGGGLSGVSSSSR